MPDERDAPAPSTHAYAWSRIFVCTNRGGRATQAASSESQSRMHAHPSPPSPQEPRLDRCVDGRLSAAGDQHPATRPNASCEVLEAFTGLFERRGRGQVLTEAGEALIERAACPTPGTRRA